MMDLMKFIARGWWQLNQGHVNTCGDQLTHWEVEGAEGLAWLMADMLPLAIDTPIKE